MEAKTVPVGSLPVSKTFKVVTLYRECSVTVARSEDLVTLTLDRHGSERAWVNGQEVEPAQAYALVERAEALTLLSEQRATPLPAEALGTVPAWGLRKKLQGAGFEWSEAIRFASQIVGRELPCIAADTLSQEEGQRVAEALAEHLSAKPQLCFTGSAYTQPVNMLH